MGEHLVAALNERAFKPACRLAQPAAAVEAIRADNGSIKFITIDDIYTNGVVQAINGVVEMETLESIYNEGVVRAINGVRIYSPDDLTAAMLGSTGLNIRGYTPDAAIVTEPTRLHVQPASRGVLLLEVDVEGRARGAPRAPGLPAKDERRVRQAPYIYG